MIFSRLWEGTRWIHFVESGLQIIMYQDSMGRAASCETSLGTIHIISATGQTSRIPVVDFSFRFVTNALFETSI